MCWGLMYVCWGLMLRGSNVCALKDGVCWVEEYCMCVGWG